MVVPYYSQFLRVLMLHDALLPPDVPRVIPYYSKSKHFYSPHQQYSDDQGFDYSQSSAPSLHPEWEQRRWQMVLVHCFHAQFTPTLFARLQSFDQKPRSPNLPIPIVSSLAPIPPSFQSLHHSHLHSFLIITSHHSLGSHNTIMEESEGISIPIRRGYNFAQRLFCVPALRTCTNTQSMELTKEQRNMRKKIMLSKQLLSSEFSIECDSEPLTRLSQLSTISLLQELYSNESWESRNLVFSALKRKRLNPVLRKNGEREDLEYYIPQLITYLAFQHDLCDVELIEFIIRSCEIHFVFSHYCYFYLNSISSVNGVEISEVNLFIKETFLPSMEIYEAHVLTGLEVIRREKSVVLEKLAPSEGEIEAAMKYGTIEEDEIKLEIVRNVELNRFDLNGYLSTPRFWEELIGIGNSLAHTSPKIVGLKKQLMEINKRLPAAVYIPFLKYRNYVILSINIQTAKVFSTKQRAPFSICIQVMKEEQEYVKDEMDRRLLHKKQTKEITVEKNENSLKLPIGNSKSMMDSEFRQSLSNTKTLIEMGNKLHILEGVRKWSNVEKEQDLKETQAMDDCQEKVGDREKSKHKESGQEDEEGGWEWDEDEDTLRKTSIHTQTSEDGEVKKDPYFDNSFEEIEAKIRSKSIYKHFKSWSLVNILIKTGDNLKQQQFAMQMINQFHIIFQKQKTELILRPYEVMSITPDSGIMEMVTDACSLGRIMKIMKREKVSCLSQFFKGHFGSRCKEAKANFCRSLAAYSLVTYFLQVKDRHNENILLHKDGYIIHIDFGFFLSNSPGQGIELEKKVPFKLMTSYVEILGGHNSSLFAEFRRLFEKGFRAAMKHKEELLLLVKMMYSSHGESMPCFKTGTVCIDEMTKRFQPETENISQHCQNLINLSLDNWRAKWYDKFQYWFQGIFY